MSRHTLYARQLHSAGNHASAEKAYIAALSESPDDPQLLNDYAVLLMQTSRREQAIEWFERSLELVPTLESALSLIICLRSTGQIARGRDIAKEIVRQVPESAIAWLLKGSLDVIAGSPLEAESSLRKCIALAPESGEAWHYLGESLQLQQRWQEAVHAYSQSMRNQPGEIFNIALCNERLGLWGQALEGYRRMHDIYPDRIDVMVRLAQAEAMSCLFNEEAETISHLKHRLTDPATALKDDDRPEAFPLSFLPLSQGAKSNLIERYATLIRTRASKLTLPIPPQRTGNAAKKRIRLGYVSADFGNHPVGELVQGVFSAHDRSCVEVYAYSLCRHDDEIARNIINSVDCFREISNTETIEAFNRIRDDAIDILIDLGGYTQGSRPEILALKPARIQIGWLGFIHGQNASWLDGLLMDKWVQPPNMEWEYSDKIIHLTTTVFPGFPLPHGKADRKRFGLPEDVMLFASFNSSYKLDKTLLHAWISIMEQAPSAWLLLCIPEHARPGFLHYWRHHGGSKNIIICDRLSPIEQASRAASCDIFLDAFRYQAGATALSSLAAGLPILTCTGNTPPSRFGTSLNRYLGMNDLVCTDTNDYIMKAVNFAHSPSALSGVRQRLRKALSESDIFDPRRTALDIERACLNLLSNIS